MSPFYDLDNTDVEDLPEHLQPDPHVVWVWIVRRENEPDQPMQVCFDKRMAEQIADKRANHSGKEMEIKRTRMWFSRDETEKQVWQIPGAGYNE